MPEKPPIVILEATPEPPDQSATSTFRTRHADRDRRRAAGEQVDRPLRTHGLEAGYDAATPNLVITRVSA